MSVSTCRSDNTCLCGHPAFMAATWSCAQSVCDAGDLGSVNGLLGAMCAAARAYRILSCFLSFFFSDCAPFALCFKPFYLLARRVFSNPTIEKNPATSFIV